MTNILDLSNEKNWLSLKNGNPDETIKSLADVNSIMAKAVKKGILKKQYMSRKLSSLSNQIKKN